MGKIFLFDHLYYQDEFQDDMFIEVGENGKIDAIGSQEILVKDDLDNGEHIKGFSLPGLVNSHSHAFQVLLRGWGDNPNNFEDWVNNCLYPLIKSLQLKDIVTATKVAYAQNIRNGITSVAEFHYIHNLLLDEDAGDDEDPISNGVIAAAKDVGIRLRFLYTGYDLGKKPGQERFHRLKRPVLRSLDTLKDRYQNDPLVHIGCAPHSLHGASVAMINALVDWAYEKNEPIHIHLSEQQSDLKLSQEKYGRSPTMFLAERDFISQHMSIVHGIWVGSEDLAELAGTGVTLITNPLTNQHLGDGIAPIPEYIRHRIPVAVGTDANVSLNMFAELRALEWMQRLKSLEMGIAGSYVADKTASQTLFDMATKNGAKALRLPIGELREGKFADFIVITLEIPLYGL